MGAKHRTSTKIHYYFIIKVTTPQYVVYYMVSITLTSCFSFCGIQYGISSLECLANLNALPYKPKGAQVFEYPSGLDVSATFYSAVHDSLLAAKKSHQSPVACSCTDSPRQPVHGRRGGVRGGFSRRHQGGAVRGAQRHAHGVRSAAANVREGKGARWESSNIINQ